MEEDLSSRKAKKRTLIDAVLSATGSSGIFTQDIEDTYNNNYAQHSNYLSTISTQSTSSNDNPRPRKNNPKEPLISH